MHVIKDNIGIHTDLEWRWRYQCGLFAIIDPSLSGKIGWLSTVESMVETSVIAKWERDNELARLLRHLDTSNNHGVQNRTVFLPLYGSEDVTLLTGLEVMSFRKNYILEICTFSNGMLYFFRIEGEINVILWRRKASQLCAFPGKKPAKTSASLVKELKLCALWHTLNTYRK